MDAWSAARDSTEDRSWSSVYTAVRYGLSLEFIGVDDMEWQLFIAFFESTDKSKERINK